MTSYLSIGLTGLFLYFYLRSKEERKLIFLLPAVILLYLAYITTPIRMHAILPLFILLEVFWNLREKNLLFARNSLISLALIIATILFIRFTGASPELEGTGVSLSASVGTLVLVNVSGDVKESAKIAELFVSQKGKRASLFEYGPLDLTLRIENDGNIHLQPKGTIQVTNMFGKTVYLSQINQDGRNVLPSSVRKFEQSMGGKLMFGPYKLKADVVYGSSNQITSDTVTFWVIPYKIIIGTILIIFLIVFAFRRYNRFIINRASKNHNATPTKPKKRFKKFKK